MAPANLPPLNPENAPAGTPLKPYTITYGEPELLQYLARTGESLAQYRAGGRAVVPPGLLLACYARLIHETFFYETGVHVSSDMVIHRLPYQDDTVTVSGEILEHFERNANQYVRFSVNVADQEAQPLATIEHVSIYKLRPRDERG